MKGKMKGKRKKFWLLSTSRRPRLVSVFVLLLGMGLVLVPSPDASKGYILLLTVKSTINPVISEYIDKGLEEAASSGAACVILQLDTPGGLDTAMRDIVQSILNSPVPVIVYVAPSGARAASGRPDHAFCPCGGHGPGHEYRGGASGGVGGRQDG